MKPTDTAELISEFDDQATKEELSSTPPAAQKRKNHTYKAQHMTFPSTTEFIGKLKTGVSAILINHALSELASSVDAL